jgi:hypothetical protein
MKKCTYCGKEYSDEALVCVFDQEPLQSDIAAPVSNSEGIPSTPATPTTPPATTLSAEKSRENRQLLYLNVAVSERVSPN